MYQPQAYGAVLVLMIVSMLCWGSWANAVKLCPGYRFQLFYWDYVIGLILGVLILGISLGSTGNTGLPFVVDLESANRSAIGFALLGGVVFNVANLFLVSAIEIAGLAVAFPIGIGLALVVGAAGSYVSSPAGNPWMLFGGVALVLSAILCDAIAYREREIQKHAIPTRGIVLSLISGVLMGGFYPLVSRAMNGANGLGPYAAAFYFAIGVTLCALPVNYLLMRWPLDGKGRVAGKLYWKAPGLWHLWGIIGGAVWSIGGVFSFVASQARMVGPAVSYSLGQGATMISAAWGVFVWREFAGVPKKSKTFLIWMFALFLIGLTLVALAPIA